MRFKCEFDSNVPMAGVSHDPLSLLYPDDEEITAEIGLGQ